MDDMKIAAQGSHSGHIEMDGLDIPWAVFGSGQGTLVIFPGLGDALGSVRGKPLLLSLAYKHWGHRSRVLVVGRPELLPDPFGIPDMARLMAKVVDAISATDAIGPGPYCVMGISQGGMIAQWLAAERSDLVGRLVLAVTTACSGSVVRTTMDRWQALAREARYRDLLVDSMESTFSAEFIKTYHLVLPLLGRVAKPRDLSSFLVQSEACAGHDARDILPGLGMPTLVFGADQDRIVGPDAAADLAARIPGARLFIAKGYGHGAYDEYRGFQDLVEKFCYGEQSRFEG
ncbi:MAG: alpha/beta fold hydrolase [Spirochaetota bacterium]